jgi:hypothetical protein
MIISQHLSLKVTGLKALGVRDLTYRLGFLASSAAQSSSDVGGQYDIRADEDDVDIAAQFSPDERDEIMRMKEQNELYVHPSYYSTTCQVHPSYYTKVPLYTLCTPVISYIH